MFFTLVEKPPMDMECYKDLHADLVALANVFICLYVLGIPTIIYLILYKNSKNLENKETLELYGSLYSQYQDRYWYWEIIESYEKCFCTVVY